MGNLSQTVSFYKTLYQLSIVAKAPILLQVGEYGSKGYKEELFKPPQVLKLTSSFFREYKCLLGCGACCHYFTMEVLPEDIPAFTKEYPGVPLSYVTHNVNGRDYPVFVLDVPSKTLFNREYCGLLEARKDAEVPFGGCTVHKQRPFSCQIEMIKFHTVAGIGYIHKKPYGRGWAMTKVHGEKGTDCEWEETPTQGISGAALQQGYENDLPSLQRMLQWAKHLQLSTYLPEIIDHVKMSLDNRDPSTWVVHEHLPSLRDLVSEAD